MFLSWIGTVSMWTGVVLLIAIPVCLVIGGVKLFRALAERMLQLAESGGMPAGGPEFDSGLERDEAAAAS